MALTFDNMPEGQRKGWLDWANSHDWGAGEARFTKNLESGILCLHVESAARDETGDWYVETFLAATPHALRAWAGY